MQIAIQPVPTITDDLGGGTPAMSPDSTGASRWRTSMRALYNYLRRDQSDARVQRELLYEKTWETHVIRTVPFVWSLARELATAYVRRPSRDFFAESETELTRYTDSAFLRRQARLYRDARVDRTMRHAHRQLVALNNATVWVWPDSTTGGVTLVLIPPHDQRVIPKHAFSLAERDVAVWRFRVQMPRQDSVGQSTWAVGQVTPEQAVWVSGPLAGKGIWVEDGSNPFGEVPVVMLRGTDPGPGEWWAPCPEDILDAQRAINHDVTDVGHIARLQGYGQPVWKTNGGKEHEQPLGPETAVVVPTDGDFGFASAAPELDAYLHQNDKYMQWSVAMNSLNPASFMKSPGITALAKQVELNDRESTREEHMEILQQAEQRLYDLIRKSINFLRDSEVLPELLVEVQYHVASMPADPLHSEQALTLQLQNGQTSRARSRARLDGISLEEAQKRVDEDMAQTAEEDARTQTPAPDEAEATETDAPVEGEVTQTPAPDGAPPTLEVEGEVQKAALNGAQVEALKGIVTDTAAGLLPRETARELILASYPISAGAVDKMLAPLDGFEPPAPSTQTIPSDDAA